MNVISKSIIFGTTLFLSAGASSRDLPLADHYFAEKNYEQALKEYMSIADIGNPKAYYQLGVIHLNGLWLEKNFLESLVWFSLAAEYDFEDSKKIVESLFSEVPDKQKQQVAGIVADYLISFGKASVANKYYPVINEENLARKVSVVDNSDRFIDPNEINEEVEEELNYFESEDEIDTNDVFFTADASPAYSTLNVPYFLIVDYDIAPDGSRRNLTPVSNTGYITNILYTLASTSVGKPTLEDKYVSFIGRSYQGTASYERALFRDKNPILFRRIRKYLLQLQKQTTPVSKYLHARTLMNYTWLESTNEQINQLLKESAEAGVVKAQLELGLKLYREQSDMKSAIYWITEAAKQTNTEAEYRLGKMFLDSPWLVNNESKSLLWLESAAKKKHIAAIKYLVQLKLLAKDESLRNTNDAIRLLDSISQSQSREPDYQFLRAVSYMKSESRQVSTAFKHMRTAINLANNLSWDTEAWEAMLAKWSSGVITVEDL